MYSPLKDRIVQYRPALGLVSASRDLCVKQRVTKGEIDRTTEGERKRERSNKHSSLAPSMISHYVLRFCCLSNILPFILISHAVQCTLYSPAFLPFLPAIRWPYYGATSELPALLLLSLMGSNSEVVPG